MVWVVIGGIVIILMMALAKWVFWSFGEWDKKDKQLREEMYS